MKNLFRIYLNGIRSVQKLFVLLLVLIRIAIFSLHAIFEMVQPLFTNELCGMCIFLF